METDRVARDKMPQVIISPISGDELKLRDVNRHNNHELSVAVEYDSGMEIYDYVVMYENDNTEEILYLPVDR